MSEGTVIVKKLDGTEIDVTEEAKAVLDLLHSSLDWGSGFLSSEEKAAWGRFANALGIVERW